MYNTMSNLAAPHRRARALHTLAAAATLGLGLIGLGSAQAAAANDRSASIEARYQAERKACLDGRTGQDQATCLKEAGASRAEALKHRLDNGEQRADLAANAVERCAVQPPDQRAACELMARGQGMESGSVRDGGVIKEVVTRSVGSADAMPVEPAKPASPASAVTGTAPPSRPASGPMPPRR